MKIEIELPSDVTDQLMAQLEDSDKFWTAVDKRVQQAMKSLHIMTLHDNKSGPLSFNVWAPDFEDENFCKTFTLSDAMEDTDDMELHRMEEMRDELRRMADKLDAAVRKEGKK